MPTLKNKPLKMSAAEKDVSEMPEEAPARAEEAPQEQPRARSPRQEVEGRRRRERQSLTQGYNLGVPEYMLDLSAYHYRWVKGDPARISQVHHYDDYDFVTQEEGTIMETSEDGHVRQVVGRNADGSAQYQYLMRKPREYFEEDQRKRHDVLKQQERAIIAGRNPDGTVIDDTAYIPDEGIRISRS